MNERAPSPRWDFTRGELARGGLVAWFTFVLLMVAAITVMAILADAFYGWSWAPNVWGLLIVLPIALVFGGAVSFVVMLAGLPIAWLLGRMLRHVRPVGVHVAVFAALGAVVGAAVAVVMGATSYGGPVSVLTGAYGVVLVALCAASVAVGWWRASREARWSRGADHRRHRHAEVEDSGFG